MSHLLEAAIGGVDAAANDAEAFALHLLAEQVVFCKKNLFMETAEFAEFLHVEQHEHAGGEGMMELREVLEEIIARVKQLVDPTASTAKNVRSYTVKLLALGEFDSAANYGRMRQFDIGIEKENVGALGLSCPQVAAD
jgi:hypothetical protein